MAAPARAPLIPVTAVLALLLSTSLHGAGKAEPVAHVPVRAVVYRPAAAALRTAAVADQESGYQPFELCTACRCCAAANASSCVDTQCCYAIDCDVPGKPFGFCAFSPRSCGCGAAGNCTA